MANQATPEGSAVRLALLALALLTPAAAAAQTFPLTLPDHCRQGSCVRIRYLERIEAARTDDGILYRLPSERLAESGRRWRIEERSDTFVFCSRTRPAYIFRFEEGATWIAHRLSPGYEAGSGGYNMLSHLGYNAVCHGVPVAFGPRATALARRYGYAPSLAERTDQIELASPRDILARR